MSEINYNYKNLSIKEFLLSYSEGTTEYQSEIQEQIESSIFDFTNAQCEGMAIDYSFTSDNFSFSEDDDTASWQIDIDNDGSIDYVEYYSFNDSGDISKISTYGIDSNGEEFLRSESEVSYDNITGEILKYYDADTNDKPDYARIMQQANYEDMNDTQQLLLTYSDISSELISNAENIQDNGDGTYIISDGENSYTVSITYDEDGNTLVSTTNNNTNEIKKSKFEMNEDGTIKSKSFDGNNDGNYEVSKEYVYENNQVVGYKYSYNPDVVQEEVTYSNNYYYTKPKYTPPVVIEEIPEEETVEVEEAEEVVEEEVEEECTAEAYETTSETTTKEENQNNDNNDEQESVTEGVSEGTTETIITETESKSSNNKAALYTLLSVANKKIDNNSTGADRAVAILSSALINSYLSD
ncbi:MAG: hypothetical protein LUG16_02845 [Candidatus Gastranaerophilales bacterium]|nr:hypothetical protein [Candidatus Gastranaerophilales bacterium]